MCIISSNQNGWTACEAGIITTKCATCVSIRHLGKSCSHYLKARTMRACDKKTDFLAESFKGSSLSLSPAAPQVLLDAPFSLFFLRAAPRSNASGEPAEPSLRARWRPGRRNGNLALVSKVTQSFVFGATRYPEHRAQNSLFASLISFKGIWTQFLVDRSVTTGEHENIKNI